MSNAWPEILKAGWAEVSRHPLGTRRFRTRRLSTELALDAHIGLRAIDNAPCLIVEAAIPSDAAFEVGGMRLAAAAGEAGPLLVLSLEDAAAIDLFTTVCADVIQTAASTKSGEELSAFLNRLDAWRRFLRERRSGLTRNETVGLMGELVVLGRLLDVDAQMLATWTAPGGSLHDFNRAGHALEIKSTVGAGAHIHISSLDQLEFLGLRQLDLLHIRFAEVQKGETLGGMITNVAGRLSEASLRDFENALLRRGLMPDDAGARAAPSVHTQSINAYSVASTFPRLIRALVPQGIAEAEYAIELRALAVHAIDAETVIAQFVGETLEGQ